MLVAWACCLALAIDAVQLRFDDYKVYKIKVETEAQLWALQEIENSGSFEGGFDFWKSPILGDEAELMVPPFEVPRFTAMINTLAMSSQLKIENVQKLIDSEQSTTTKSSAFDFAAYHDLTEFYSWLDQLLEEYPRILTGYNVGYSYEGRTIRGLRLSYKQGNPTVFLDASIHAREWVTSASLAWILNEFLTSNDTNVRDLAENIDWVIVPIINADGFQYSHTNNRLWRKTRQPHSFLCYGADPNRNFNSSWNSIGSSSNPCAQIYAGPHAFSEPETLALSKFIAKSGAKVYLSLHSYGQYVLYPRGHTSDRIPNYDTVREIGIKTAEAFERRYGNKFTVGAPPEVLYATSGSSMDWSYEHDIPIAYTIELRDTGENGFVLPADQIIPAARETLDGFIVLLRTARQLQQL